MVINRKAGKPRERPQEFLQVLIFLTVTDGSVLLTADPAGQVPQENGEDFSSSAEFP